MVSEPKTRTGLRQTRTGLDEPRACLVQTRSILQQTIAALLPNGATGLRTIPEMLLKVANKESREAEEDDHSPILPKVLCQQSGQAWKQDRREWTSNPCRNPQMDWMIQGRAFSSSSAAAQGKLMADAPR